LDDTETHADFRVSGPANIQSVVRLATAGAAFVMAFQVAGKAARDALFLSNYRPSQMPPVIVAGAFTAIILGVMSGRLLAIFQPRRIVPVLLLGSAGLHVLEWFTYRQTPGPTAIAIYIHVVALGAVITSGFWSVINEQLDPYTAKQNFGKIAGAGTAGGVAGGFIAERIAALAPEHAVLFVLTFAQAITGAVLLLLPSGSARARREKVRARDLLRRSSYLRQLSLLVLIGTFSAALLDYVLKANARHTLGPGEPLLRFFAIFHSGTAALAFLLQIGATTPLLNRFGLGGAIATLPAGVALTAVFAALSRAFPLIVAARAVEAVIRGSLFRAGYELLYTPMPASEKRAIKSINDVAVDRLGDALGGGFAQAAILLGPISGPIMLVTASLASGVGWLLSRTLQRGYVRSLERSLKYHAPERSSGSSSRRPQTAIPFAPVPPPTHIDRAALPFIVPMLAVPEFRESARNSIASIAAPNIGQLTDYLLDPATEIEVRMELPKLIATAGTHRAADALLLAIGDPDSKLRTECARALAAMAQSTGFKVQAERVYSAVTDELHGRADLSLVFTLLGLVLPREPLRIAFESLNASDAHRRGLALEYLETALPTEVAGALLDAVEELRPEFAPAA
jgi:hypothetical protein